MPCWLPCASLPAAWVFTLARALFSRCMEICVRWCSHTVLIFVFVHEWAKVVTIWAPAFTQRWPSLAWTRGGCRSLRAVQCLKNVILGTGADRILKCLVLPQIITSRACMTIHLPHCCRVCVCCWSWWVCGYISFIYLEMFPTPLVLTMLPSAIVFYHQFEEDNQ